MDEDEDGSVDVGGRTVRILGCCCTNKEDLVEDRAAAGGGRNQHGDEEGGNCVGEGVVAVEHLGDTDSGHQHTELGLEHENMAANEKVEDRAVHVVEQVAAVAELCQGSSHFLVVVPGRAVWCHLVVVHVGSLDWGDRMPPLLALVTAIAPEEDENQRRAGFPLVVGGWLPVAE